MTKNRWRRAQEPPFTEQLDHEKLIERWSGLLTDLERKTDQEGLARAIGIYRHALDRRSDDWLLHHRLAFLLEAAGDFSGAERQWKRVVEIIPEATVHLGLANSFEATGRGSEALAHYQEAIRLNPALAEAHFNLGVALAKRGDLTAATRCFQEAARLNPEDPQAHLNLGVALAQQSRLGQAIVEFQAVLRLDPANAAAKQYLHSATAREQSKQ